jgi:phage terminase large subunit-like protein
MLDANGADKFAITLLKQFVFYEPTLKQQAFHRAGLSAGERLFLGGNRTGKTNAVCMELAMHLTGVYPKWWQGYRFSRPINAISASISLKDTRDILQKKLFVGDIDKSMPAILHESYIDSKTHTTIAGAWDTVRIHHVSGGVSELKFKAFQQGESSFQGVKADFIHLDEVPNFRVYQEALMRTTSFDSEKTFLVVSMWPERGKDELITHFLDNASEGEISNGRCYIMASWADNPHLKSEERERLRKSVPAWQLEAREHGIPVFGQGKVFTILESEIFVEPFEIPNHFARVYGLDPSASSGGTWGAVLLAHDRDKDIVYAVADYKLSNATPTEHASNISRMIPEWCTGMVDPAGAGENMHTKEKTIDFLANRSGLYLVKAHKANNTKEATIDEIYERVRGDRFKIIYSTKGIGCRHLVNEWRQYARDDNGLILKKNDHCIDALFYALGGLPYARTQTQFYHDKAPRWQEAGYL